MALSLIDELKQLLDALTKVEIEYAVCGGIAVNIHGHPRTTNDIDLLIREQDLNRTLDLIQKLGFDLLAGKIPFQTGTDQERALYRASKAEAEAFLTIDLMMVTPILEDVWKGRQVFTWMNREIPVVSLEGLTKMKLLAGRHQDLADIENLGIEVENEDSESEN